MNRDPPSNNGYVSRAEPNTLFFSRSIKICYQILFSLKILNPIKKIGAEYVNMKFSGYHIIVLDGLSNSLIQHYKHNGENIPSCNFWEFILLLIFISYYRVQFSFSVGYIFTGWIGNKKACKLRRKRVPICYHTAVPTGNVIPVPEIWILLILEIVETIVHSG